MNFGSPPPKIAYVFASAGTANTIPATTSGITTSNQACYQTGFPNITMVPIPSGGLPPYGADFNGILKAITQVSNWQSAGGMFAYDSVFATTVSGYPKGALLCKNTGIGLWQSIVDANTTNPDAGGAGWQDPVISSTVNATTDPSFTNSSNSPASTNWVTGKTQTITPINDPTIANISASPASTSWVKFGFSASIGANGYVQFPKFLGGFMIQWGVSLGAISGGSAVSFPTSFPNNCFIVSLNDYGTAAHTIGYYSKSLTGFNVYMNTSPSSFSFFAIGN